MTDINFKTNTIGKAFIVDPNPPNNETIPLEDMFIYVKFSAYPRSRTTYNGTDLSGDDQFLNFGVEDEVNFISTKISYNENGKIDPTLQQTYATTDWTNISSFGNTTSSGILEGFGIKSISIKYNASLVPQVDITFTDVRGSALFDTLSNGTDVTSPYAVFFRMPYPVFRLSIKGYFGQKVDYCLHMINWTSSFDNTTGNFDISANFLGYQQAILNDLVLGNIIGVVNTEKGKNNLKKIFNKKRESNEQIIDIEQYKLDNFIINISKLQVEAQLIKSDLDSFKDFENLKKKVGLLRQIRSFIGSPLPKDSKNDVDKNKKYLQFPNIENQIITNGIESEGTQLTLNSDYLSIRDFLVLKLTKQQAFKKFIINLNDAVKQYIQFIRTTENKKTNNKNNNNELYLVGDEDLIDSFFVGDLDDEDSWLNYVSSFTKDVSGDSNKIQSTSIRNIFDGFQNVDSEISLTKNGRKLGKDLNSNFSIQSFISVRNIGNSLRGSVFSTENDQAILIDFRTQRSLLEANIRDLEEKIKVKFKEVSDELNKILLKNLKENNSFSPKMKDSFEILMNNSQAMISTIRDITINSENANPKFRNRFLISKNTDIPNSSLINNDKSVAFPSIYNDNNEEVYIGSLFDIEKTFFPEIDFVDEVYRNIVNKKSVIENLTYDGDISSIPNSDKWFPINPIDYKDNPYISLGSDNNIEKINNSLIKTITTRVCVLKNYSKFSNTYLNGVQNYAKYDAINAKNVIYNKKIRDVIKSDILERLNQLNNTQLFDEIKKILPDITINNGEINIPNNILEVGDIKITSDYSGNSESSNFIGLEISDIVNNNKELFDEISNDNTYINKVRVENETPTKYGGNNIKTTCLKETLFITPENDFDKLTYSDINPDGKFLNKNRFKIPILSLTCSYDQNLVDSVFYKQQLNIYARSFLCLSTFPFNYIKNGFLNILFTNKKYENARIVEIPELFLYYIGSLLWRLETDETDGVSFNINLDSNCSYDDFSSPKDKYLSKFGSKNEIRDIEEEISKLPLSVKNFFIEQFKDWTDKNFKDDFTGDFEEIFRNIVKDEETAVIKKSKNQITKLLIKTKNLIIFNINIFNPKKSDVLTVNVNDISNYINNFNVNFGGDNLENTNDNPNESDDDLNEETDNDIKLAIYQYFKNVNDKWVSDTENGFNICGGNNLTTDLIDYFKFIDRGWNDIGDKVVLDLKSFVNTASNLNSSVYSLVSKVLRDNNFILQILPNYINFTDLEEVKKIFAPQTTIENNSSSGPIFCCIYTRGNSKHLNIDERVTSFVKDGFSVDSDDAPSDISDINNRVKDLNGDDYSLVAFKVAFGSQNQSLFKSVNLNQQEHKETAEYFKALSELIDKRGGSQRSYKGTNLLRLFNTRSYSCTVESLGCMGIQPLMYFDLQNVPFFNGAYLITSVDHNISPNHMTTTFKGLRQSKFRIPLVSDITTSLKINLNDSIDIPKIEFQPNNSNYSIGVLNPDQRFDFGANFDIVKFKSIGVTDSNITQETLDEFAQLLGDYGINTNAQVCMFITNVFRQSNYLSKKTYEWELERTSPNKLNKNVLFYGNIDNPNNQNKIVKPVLTSDTTDNKYYTYQPIFSGTSNISSDLTGEFISFSPTDNTSKLDDKKFLNTQTGDKYFFRPFGYLYVIGRKQYEDYAGGNLISIISKRKSIEENNNLESLVSSFDASIWVWQNVEGNGKTCFKTIDEQNKENQGKSTIFSRTVEISQQLDDSNKINESFSVFEKVLTNFVVSEQDKTKLIDFFSG